MARRPNQIQNYSPRPPKRVCPLCLLLGYVSVEEERWFPLICGDVVPIDASIQPRCIAEPTGSTQEWLCPTHGRVNHEGIVALTQLQNDPDRLGFHKRLVQAVETIITARRLGTKKRNDPANQFWFTAVGVGLRRRAQKFIVDLTLTANNEAAIAAAEIRSQIGAEARTYRVPGPIVAIRDSLAAAYFRGYFRDVDQPTMALFVKGTLGGHPPVFEFRGIMAFLSWAVAPEVPRPYSELLGK